MVDLNHLIDPDSGWILEVASAINAEGMIVGTGTFGGTSRAFLLRPMNWDDDIGGGSTDPDGGGGGAGGGSHGSNPHAAPEPGSIGLVLIGAFGASAWSWSRRRRSRS
jgi:hypothetical protein